MTKNSELGCQQTPFQQPGAIHGYWLSQSGRHHGNQPTPVALGQWGVAGLLGPAGDCTPAIEALNAPEAQWTAIIRRRSLNKETGSLGY